MPEQAAAAAGLEADLADARAGFGLEVSLQVAPGETLALMGPSGAGKSTCLALVAGLRRPRRGRVACGGEVWCDTAAGRDLPPEARRVGVLFQDFALFPHLSARDNVAYGPRARGRGAAEAAAEAARWLERVGLREAAGRRPAQLSGGQRQRVALARALASGARALLLDEPFGSLDAATRASVRSELRSVLAEAGLPTLLVTHDPVDAFALGRRVAVMENGRLSQVGTHEELAERPRSAFVAEVAGLNLYAAHLPGGAGLQEARVRGLGLHVLGEGMAGECFLVFAPTDVTLSGERRPGSAQNTFRARVREVRRAAERVAVLLEVHGEPMTAQVTHAAASALGLAPGREVWASVKATAIRVYR